MISATRITNYFASSILHPSIRINVNVVKFWFILSCKCPVRTVYNRVSRIPIEEICTKHISVIKAFEFVCGVLYGPNTKKPIIYNPYTLLHSIKHDGLEVKNEERRYWPFFHETGKQTQKTSNPIILGWKYNSWSVFFASFDSSPALFSFCMKIQEK